MVQYASVNFDTYIKEADLIKGVLCKNPVPENISSVKTLDNLMKDILKDQKKQKDLDFDNVFEKFQGGNQSVMCPISNVWTTIDSARLYQEDSMEDNLKKFRSLWNKLKRNDITVSEKTKQ